MTNIMKLFAVAMLLISAQSANAISLRFKFKTFSSGPDIYACNAGLRHQPTQHKACYFENTQVACTPQECNGAQCDTRCVCTNNNGGEYLMDYMKGSYSTWTNATPSNNGGYWNTNWTATSKQAGGSSYATLVNNPDAFATRIKELSFNLGSELYGAEYFVDICYRGPQIEYFADNVVANFSILAQATATDFIANSVNPGDNHPESGGANGEGQNGLTMNPASPKYTSLAGLTVQAFVVCDVQGQGTYKYAHNGSSANSGDYNTLLNEASFQDWNNPGSGSNGDYFASSNPTSIASASSLINGWINNNNTKTPRFCRVRYVFKETNGSHDSAASFMNLRKWQRHGAEMCTYTKIEESL